MRFIQRGLALLLVLCLCAPLWAGQDTVKIGALYNLTGGMSAIDLPASKGARLAAQILNSKAGVLDGSKLELIVIDTKTDLKAAKDAAKKLTAIPVVAGIGYGDTDFVLQAAPEFQENMIPFLTTGATDPELPETIGDFMFLAPFGDDDQAHAMAEFALKDLDAKNIALWTNGDTHFTRILTEFFKERYMGLGGKICSERTFDSKKKDFSDFIDELKEAKPKPQAIFISAIPENAKPTVDQIREAGLDIPILSGDGFDSSLLEMVSKPQYANSVYFTSHAFLGSTRPRMVRFVEAYEKEYGQAPENSYATLGFDAVNLLAKVIEKAGTTDSKAIARALSNVGKFEGVRGEISYSGGDRTPNAPVHIIGIENGDYKLAKTWVPGEK